jgi:L-asparaginase/Glu-tRNA(Gln) amidotransferase subunit D
MRRSRRHQPRRRGQDAAIGKTHEEGMIPTDNLNPQKAAILLAYVAEDFS